MKYTFLTYLFLTIVACHNHKDANAKPMPAGTPPKLGHVELQYADTNLPETKIILRSLDTFYNARITAGFNGSVLIGYKGKIIYERFCGVAQKETGLPLSKETASQLASTSKTLTSGAVLMLKDRGLVNLDDYVSSYLPTFPYSNITVRMLLNHRSGLPDYTHFGETLRSKELQGKMMSNDELLSILSTKKPKLNFVPNTHFTYCNTNYAVLASLVEAVSKMPFAEFMRTMIFEPLEMKHTYIFNPATGHPSSSACSYKFNFTKEPDMYLDGVVGDKGCYSTVEDMYKWDQALYKAQIIKPSSLNEAFTPYSFEKEGIKNYGLGWRMWVTPNQPKVIFHNGWWHGNNTVFYRFLDDNFTIIVLGNRFNKSIYYQTQGICNIIKGTNTPTNVEEAE